MDSRSNSNEYGSSRSSGMVGAVLLFVGVCAGSALWAFPPPTIRPSGKPQTLLVIDPTLPAVFPEQSWKIVAPNPLGPTVAFWTVQPFRNDRDHSLLVDAQLNLRTLDSGKKSDWQVLIPAARTQFVSGQTVAQVVAASVGGNGEAGITVSFLGHEQPLLADGVFETTVVGTITEAF